MNDKSPKRIQMIFNKIAKSYDFMNNIISLGLHKIIKHRCINMLDVVQRSKIMDLCCGTGDTAWLIKKQYMKTNVIGVDFSENMLEIARKKCRYVEFYRADATNLPFEKCEFSTITCTFGLRNIEDIDSALDSIYKVLKVGGEFMHLDFGTKNLASKIFDFYVPIMCRIFHKNPVAYAYLIKSKKEWKSPEELISLFESHKFKLKKRKDFLFGTISMQIMTK